MYPWLQVWLLGDKCSHNLTIRISCRWYKTQNLLYCIYTVI